MATIEIVGAAEAAEILQIGNTNFSHMRKQREGQEDAFPEPFVILKCGPIWLKKDVDRFAKTFAPRRRGPVPRVEAPEVEKPAAPAKKSVAKKAVAKPSVAKKKLSLVR